MSKRSSLNQRDSGDESIAARGEEAESTSVDPIISVSGLSKTYGHEDQDGAVTAVDDISFEIEPGTVVGILGPNGAGKTTTIKMLLGLILPDSGTIEIAGEPIGTSPRRVYQSISAMLEGARNTYWRLTLRENLRFFTRLSNNEVDPERIDRIVKLVGLTEKSDVPVNELSRGMKQKVSLACTLIRDTPIAVLDEPTLGLDIESERDLRAEIQRIVEEENRTILLSSHNMDVIEDVCDRVILMDDGEIIVDETVEDLLEIFNTTAYRIVIEEELSSEQRSKLASRYGVENWTSDAGTYSFEATQVARNEFPELIDDVDGTGTTIRSVEKLDPDLEEIFLSITDDATNYTGNRADSTADASSADGVRNVREVANE